jgi:hypothetical protein
MTVGSAQMHRSAPDIPNIFNVCDETTAQMAPNFAKISLTGLNPL